MWDYYQVTLVCVGMLMAAMSWLALSCAVVSAGMRCGSVALVCYRCALCGLRFTIACAHRCEVLQCG